MLERLTEAVSAVCPINGISGTVERRIDYRPEATAEQRAAAQSALAAFDASQAAHDAWLLAKHRSAAVAALNASRDEAIMAARSVTLAALDEVNALRAWITAFKAAVAASSSLADMKTRVAATSSMPARTNTKLRTVITTAINNGSADQ